MKKIVLALIVFSIICMVLTGCIHWETSVDYKLLHDTSQIQSIRIYKTKSGIGYNYSDPIDPCSALLGEISSDQVADFVEELAKEYDTWHNFPFTTHDGKEIVLSKGNYGIQIYQQKEINYCL